MLLRVAGRSPGKSLEMHLPVDGPLSVLADGHNACISISLFFVAALLLLSFFLPHSIFLYLAFHFHFFSFKNKTNYNVAFSWVVFISWLLD